MCGFGGFGGFGFMPFLWILLLIGIVFFFSRRHFFCSKPLANNTNADLAGEVAKLRQEIKLLKKEREEN